VTPVNYAMFAEIDFKHPLFAPFADPRFSDFTKIHIWKYRKLDAAGIPDARMSLIADEQQAIDAALRMASTGDLVLIFADALARGWKQIINFRPDSSASIIPAPRAARAVPRQAVHEDAPADDTSPAKASTSVMGEFAVVTARWSAIPEDVVLMRDARGVIVAPESSD